MEQHSETDIQMIAKLFNLRSIVGQMHSALQREKLTAANRTVPSSQLAFHAMQRRRFLENSALASLPLLSSLALLPGCAVYERNIHSDDRPSADAPAGRFRGVRQPNTGIQVYLGIPFMKIRMSLCGAFLPRSPWNGSPIRSTALSTELFRFSPDPTAP